MYARARATPRTRALADRLPLGALREGPGPHGAQPYTLRAIYSEAASLSNLGACFRDRNPASLFTVPPEGVLGGFHATRGSEACLDLTP